MARTDVRLVQASTAACADGIAALANGRAGVVLTEDEASLLPTALDAAAGGFAVVSQRVLEAAAAMPDLSAGDLALLRLIGDGASNAVAAALLGTSVGRVKTAVARLVRTHDVAGRAGLVELARSLGV